MELRESQRRGEVADYTGEKERLRREVSHHLRDRPMPDRDSPRRAERAWLAGRSWESAAFSGRSWDRADQQQSGAGAAWSCDSEEGLALLQE